MNKSILTFTGAMVVVLGCATTLFGQTKLLRFPDIQGDTVVFCYGGDLWRASVTGGIATRLTAHRGQELFPKFSPDGAWIAFTGQYDGDEQVYVIPAAGGVPRQLTYYPARGPLAPRWGFDNQVYGWSPDGNRVLFRSMRDADGGRTLTALYTVDREGGLPVALPMPTSGAGDYSPAGDEVVYSPLFRDFRTWKRYEGGWAQNLYVFNLATHQVRPVAHSPRTERDPMWIGDAIYFSSDRQGTLNLYRFDLATSAVTPLTTSTNWDVRWPSSDNQSRIVFEQDGELHVVELATQQVRRLAITVPDDGLSRRPARQSASDSPEDFELSPQGERALFVAWGDIFTAPIEKGPTRNLTASPGAHDKHARWSPDGSRIAFVSDQSGEEQIYIVTQDGASAPDQVTERHRAMLYAPAWSPDSQRLAYSDKDGKLFVLTLETRAILEIADAARGGIRDYTWSPDSGFLAFTMPEPNEFRAIHVWAAQDGTLHRVTDGLFNDSNPSWDPDGQYLFYISRRQFAPQISSIEWNYAGNRDDGLFALLLQKTTANLFAPESDEVRLPGQEKKSKPSEDAKEATDDEGQASAKAEKTEEDRKEPVPVKIDFEGLAQRVARVPVPDDNLGGLQAIKGHLIYTVSGARFYGRNGERETDLHIFELKERKDSVLLEDAGNYAISHDGQKVLARSKEQFQLLDAKPSAKEKKTVSTKDLVVDRVPDLEWRQIFDEVWRRYRDFFYVRNMHGYDWEAIREQYLPWVAHVAHRSDLNYVLGEMVSELNVGHAYIEGGSYETPERPKVGLPGARFRLDPASGRYQIAQIFAGHNAEEKYRSPLTQPGVDIQEGDYVLAIDGQPLRAPENPYRLLRHKTDPITLTINRAPEEEGARRVTYEPIFNEASLLYLQWVVANQAKVAAATEGQVGYVHIPNMSADGIYEFIKWYYPQIRKQGLVIDVRSNGGGNVSQWILERLDTRLLGTWWAYDSVEPSTYPSAAFHGHLVCLINETSASDGDIFPSRFREAGLGPLIGKRTWGGVIGISNQGPLIDGATAFVPMVATSDRDGQYIIEGHGVDPDIEVENDAASVIARRDPQLERGIAEVLRRIRENPRRLPQRPPDPVKTK